MKAPLIVLNESKEFCSACGGHCCKSLPGATWPDDWGKTRKTVLAAVRIALHSGLYCLDWWEGDPVAFTKKQFSRVLFVRPAIKALEGKLEDPSWGGICHFLTPAGCSLEFSKRPFDCRDFQPDRKFPDGCKSGTGKGGKYGAAMAWRPYQTELESLISEIRRGEAAD